MTELRNSKGRVVHDAAGPCEPDYHRGMPSWGTCRCELVRNNDIVDTEITEKK